MAPNFSLLYRCGEDNALKRDNKHEIALKKKNLSMSLL